MYVYFLYIQILSIYNAYNKFPFSLKLYITQTKEYSNYIHIQLFMSSKKHIINGNASFV